MREMVEIRSRWRLREVVKQVLDNTPGRSVSEKSFICGHCKRPVPAVAPGARPRSHCPHCLWSLHVESDEIESASQCRGQMEPVGVSTQAGGEWSLVHHCRQCHATQVNTIAVDDNATALLQVAVARPSMK
jgi:ribosome biogenesis GTPase / thiamine phosphate phosphatase